MGWTNYPTVLNGYPQPGQAASSNSPYTSAQLNNSAIPQSIRDQMAGAQQLQQAATSTTPHTSGLVNGLQALAGYMGGRQEAQADAAAAPYQQGSAQPSPSILARVLRGDAGTPDPSSPGAPMQLAGATPPNDPSQNSGSGILGAIGRKSDRRLKSEVTRIGTLPSGLAVYRYRLEGGPFEIGCMADEVALVRPDATWFDPDDGFARVDYAKVL